MKNQMEFAKVFQCKAKDAMVLPENDGVKRSGKRWPWPAQEDGPGSF